MLAQSQTRRAVTLLELLLTLSLLVVIASMVWPSVTAGFENRRLQIAAEQVRSDLISARVKAINTGITYVLWYEPESNVYRVEPYQADAAEVGGELATVGTAADTADVDRGDLAPLERQLPDGISFVGLETSGDLREQITTSEGPTLGQNSLATESNAAQKILCYPDGTTGTAELYLSNKAERCISLDLRGLTGVITVGEVRPLKDLTG